jgi:hypothetical protein
VIKRTVLSLIFLILVFGFLFAPKPEAQAAEEGKKPQKQQEKYLTKGEAAVLISATDFMREKIGALLSWTIGYDITKVNRTRLIPVINYVLAVPKAVPPDGRTVLEIKASVDDPSGLKNISGVRADLTALGRLPNMMLVDNGLWGDEKAGDGVYTLQTSVSPKIEIGGKEIPVAAANKKGWLAMAKTSLEVAKSPRILKAQALPQKIVKGKTTAVLLVVEVYNPGRIEDLTSVTVDLEPLGGAREVPLYNNGSHGDKVALDDVFSLVWEVRDPVSEGIKRLPVAATNALGSRATGEMLLEVVRE